MSSTITVHTDGSCAGNPGPGGFAAIIQIPGMDETVISGGDRKTTNNRMEMSAAVEALNHLSQSGNIEECTINLHSDSQHLVRAFQERWMDKWLTNGWKTVSGKPVLNQDLWKTLIALNEALPISWIWVKGHSGNPMNERCDRIAVHQAELAANRSGYWCDSSASGPVTAVAVPHSEPEPRPSPSRTQQESPEGPQTDTAAHEAQQAVPAQNGAHPLEELAQRLTALTASGRIPWRPAPPAKGEHPDPRRPAFAATLSDLTFTVSREPDHKTHLIALAETGRSTADDLLTNSHTAAALFLEARASACDTTETLQRFREALDDLEEAEQPQESFR